MATETAAVTEIFRLCLSSESDIIGAATFDFNLVVDAMTGTVNGIAEIKQSIAPPNGDVRFPVSGQYHTLVFGGNVTHTITLTGEYIMHCTPPALCLYRVPFSAGMTLDENFDGKGVFHYGNRQTTEEVVTKEEC